MDPKTNRKRPPRRAARKPARLESPTRLYLIRHGEVEERYQRVFGGRIDMNLSPIGQEQASALASYLQRVPFEMIYASPMKRARQTLERLAAMQSRLPVFVDDLREVDFGHWTGLGWEEVQEKFQKSAFDWLDHLEKGIVPEAESARHFRRRVKGVLADVIRECPGKTVALVCHGGVIRMALSILLDIPLRKMAGFEVEYTSVTIVDHLPRKAEVQLLNFTPWRDQG